jgi:hypothetical protein
VRTGLPPRPPQLSRARRQGLYAVGVGVWLSGALWLLFHYFLLRDGPFGPSPHPLEFWSRAAHGALGFASLWVFGMLWSAHLVEGWRSRRRRWSGSAAFALVAWLVVSGYLLYYLGNDGLISIISLLHWSVGLSLPVPFLLHRFAGTPAKNPAA